MKTLLPPILGILKLSYQLTKKRKEGRKGRRGRKEDRRKEKGDKTEGRKVICLYSSNAAELKSTMF